MCAYIYVNILSLLGTFKTGSWGPGGGADGTISASFAGVVRQTQAGNHYTVILTRSLLVGGAGTQAPQRRCDPHRGPPLQKTQGWASVPAPVSARGRALKRDTLSTA